VENNLRKVLEQTQKRFKGKIVLVYGDLCLGQDNEMKKLAQEYGVTKVDAVNCVDCQLDGKGKFNEADPDHNLMFMGPGMIGFFKHAKEQMLKEGVDEAAFANMFSGIKGMVILDTCGDVEKCVEDVEKSGINLEILEIRKIGTDNVKRVILDAINRANIVN
jgi:microsomal dipeptidase-like Zn-dependent dipeptidase